MPKNTENNHTTCLIVQFIEFIVDFCSNQMLFLQHYIFTVVIYTHAK